MTSYGAGKGPPHGVNVLGETRCGRHQGAQLDRPAALRSVA